jgi:hypothetical protein
MGDNKGTIQKGQKLIWYHRLLIKYMAHKEKYCVVEFTEEEKKRLNNILQKILNTDFDYLL